MTILDTFYLLFKTDIPTSAHKDIAALDKQLDILGAKGKKRSEEENKEYKELQKRRKEATQDLKDQQKQVDQIGESFTDLAQKGLQALTAFATFQGIKSGLLDTASLNSSLLIQSKITGQNVDELRAYSAAVESAGGTASGFTSSIYSMTQAAAQNGLAFKNVGAFLDSLHQQMMELHDAPQERLRILGLAGITDPGTIAFLEQSNEEYKKSVDLQKKLTGATREDYEASRTFEAARSDALHSLTSAFTRLGADVLPTASAELAKFDDYIKELEKQKGGVEAFFAETAAAGILAWTPLGRLVLAMLVAAKGIGSAESDIAHPDRPRQSLLGRAAGRVSDTLLDWIYGPIKRSNNEPFGPPVPGRKTGNSALDFWLSQGYSPAQAAGLAANEQAESGGRAAARNFQKGTHYGLYQWDEARRAKIRAGTGIDVANASAQQQRSAAAWELQQRGDAARIRSANTPEGAAAIGNSYFEVSGENPLERMRLAHQLAAQYSLPQIPASIGAQSAGPGRTVSVKIDEVTINTQATDANGIFANAATGLSHEIHTAFSDFDDGQNY